MIIETKRMGEGRRSEGRKKGRGGVREGRRGGEE